MPWLNSNNATNIPEDILRTHIDYDRFYNKWRLIERSLKGEEAIKKMREKYLPYPVALDADARETQEFKDDYEIYLQNAHYVEYTSEAVEDLVSSMFRRDIEIDPELPDVLSYFRYNEFFKDLATVVCAYGRAFVLTDYPPVDSLANTRFDDKENFAYTAIYDALHVTNWDYNMRSGQMKLQRVVLREIDDTVKPNEDYVMVQYRELILEDGVYKVKIYRESGKNEEFVPRVNGKTLDYIPATFVGVTSNSPKVDKSPVIGIANSNLKHYQTWAELMATQTYLGHPQLVATGLPAGFNKKVQDSGITLNVGASKVLTIEGEDAKVDLLQISPDVIHYQTLEKLEHSMLEQGARIKSLNIKAGVESAEAMTIRHSSDVSKLGAIVENIEKAGEFVLEQLGAFMGVSYTPTVTINKSFFAPSVDSQMISTLQNAEVMGVVPAGTVYKYLLANEVISSEDPEKDIKVIEDGTITSQTSE